MSANDDTIELSRDAQFAESFFAASSSPVRATIGAATHAGKVRRNNEDHYLVIRRSRWQEVVSTNLPAGVVPTTGDEDYMLMVADGIGGGVFGEVASRRVLQVLWDLTSQATSWVMRLTDLKAQELRQRVNAYSQRIEQYLQEMALCEPALVGAGTTLTFAHVMQRDIVVANIGDSRAYVFRRGACRQITRDQTMGQRFLDAGLDSEDVKRLHHILLNCLSVEPDSTVAPELHLEHLNDGDRLLLCTDGLSDMLSDEEIAATLQRRPDAQAACDALVERALERGGKDNITVALLQIEVPDANGPR